MSKAKFEKILIFKKTSKLQYLIDKYGNDQVKKSPEYEKLYNSMSIQEENTTRFINCLLKNVKHNQHIQIITDNFKNNENLISIINKDTFDQVYSLGGDGTFLRSIALVNNGNPLFVGVNTDLKRSTGFYCRLNINDDDLNIKVNKLLNKEFTEKKISKARVSFPAKNETFYFINDMYFGEKFLGRVSKYDIILEKSEVHNLLGSSFNCTDLKSLKSVDSKYSLNYSCSGIIFSTCNLLIILIFILHF